MTWNFVFMDANGASQYRQPCNDWASAHAALREFIDLVRPPLSYRSLKTECENFPIDVPVSITDGQYVFGIARHAA